MSIEQLKDLSRKIGLELDNRIIELQETKAQVLENVGQYEFVFESELLDRKPYVARCSCKGREIDRLFKNIPSEGNACSGKYTAFEGEILDIRDNDGRGYYAVYNGELTYLCSPRDSMNICRIKQYLKCQMEFNVLLEILGVKEIDNSIIDDLKDEQEICADDIAKAFGFGSDARYEDLSDLRDD